VNASFHLGSILSTLLKMPPTFGVQSRDPKIFLPIIKYIVTCKRPYWPTIGIGATNIPYYIKVRHRDILPARLNSTPP